MSRIMTIILYITILNFSYVVSKDINVLYKISSFNVLLFTILVFLIILVVEEE
jgi:hypothetical protein